MGCYSYFGSTFNPIVGADGSIEAKSHLAGAYNFEVKEMEVFTVEFEWLMIFYVFILLLIYNIKILKYF